MHLDCIYLFVYGAFVLMGMCVPDSSEYVDFRGPQTRLSPGHKTQQECLHLLGHFSCPSIHCLMFIFMISCASISYVIITWEIIFYWGILLDSYFNLYGNPLIRDRNIKEFLSRIYKIFYGQITRSSVVYLEYNFRSWR